ncbi:3,4-dihydroxy-2-butanone-4-phosphate synthase, partial [Candidatus Gottesmanbacteria bacterium]|nr:3,4-dihydroxy-2-butanone-4-phosphate synthase [Candidatus Gottesmanbacteria bacterium]
MNKAHIAIPEAIEEIKKGKMLILLDQKREKEADFYIPADKLTPQMVNTMIKLGGGLICAAITQKQAHKLALPLMVEPLDNDEKTGVNFTISVDAEKNTTTGVSVNDRFKTIKALSNPKSNPSALLRPGHIFGLIAQNEGVLERAGHTESAVDLARLANLNPAGVLCEILSDNGQTAGLPDLIKLSKKLKVKIVLIEELVKYLKANPLPKPDESSCVIKTAQSNL